MNIIRFISVFFMLPALAWSQGDRVRKSTTGLCHPPESSYYDQVIVKRDGANIFPNIEECLKSGGKLPKALPAAFSEDSVIAEEFKRAEDQGTKENNDIQKFAGLNWGPGLMFAFSNDETVRDVSIEKGTIRVNHALKNRAIAVLETHYFFTPGKENRFGIGPFVSIGLVGEEGINPLSLFGAGVLFGFRDDGEQVNSWNFGFGYFIDTEAQTLRDALADGDTTTETDPTKLIQKSDIGGPQIIFSAAF